MPQVKLPRSASMAHLSDPKDKAQGKDAIKAQLRKSASFAEGMNRLDPNAAQQAAVMPPVQAPVQGPEGQVAPVVEPNPLPEAAAHAGGQPAQEGPGYTHLHVTAANMRVGEQAFEGRTGQEFAAIRAELMANAQGAPVKERDVRFEMMRRRVEAASANRARAGDRAMGLFTAPEGALGDNLKKSDVNWYRRHFKELSAAHPDMTIMPGTMNWQERTKKRRGLGKKTALRTTGDVFHGGKRVHTVNKHRDAGDTSGQRVLHRRGKPAASGQRAAKWYNRGKGPRDGGSRFDVAGVKMGYEICADHDDKRLRRELHKTGADVPDVHVVNAAGNSYSGGHAALTAGGIAVSNNGVMSETQVGQAEGDYDPTDEELMNNPQNNQMEPGHLMRPLPMGQMQRSRLPAGDFDPEAENPYDYEEKGLFPLPGR